MRQTDFARLCPLPAAGKRRLRRRVVRLAERRPHHEAATLKHAGDAVASQTGASIRPPPINANPTDLIISLVGM